MTLKLLFNGNWWIWLSFLVNISVFPFRSLRGGSHRDPHYVQERQSVMAKRTWQHQPLSSRGQRWQEMVNQSDRVDPWPHQPDLRHRIQSTSVSREVRERPQPTDEGVLHQWVAGSLQTGFALKQNWRSGGIVDPVFVNLILILVVFAKNE